MERRFDAAADFDGLISAVENWDALRRRLRTWQALVQLRFRQDTRDEKARADRAHADELQPALLARDSKIKRRLLEHPSADQLHARFGHQAFRLWEADLQSYAPAVDALLVQESKLVAEYTSLFGAIAVEFDGRRMTLPELRGYLNHQNRDLRHASEHARWAAVAERGGELDRLFGDLVGVRHAIGKALGHDTFIPVAYARMQRVDYDQSDVERWRDSVVSDVVPLASDIVARSASRLGHRIMSWDESVLLAADSNPTVQGADIVARLPDVLGAIDRRLGSFGAFMRDRDFLDVLSREGKGPGGFCTSFPTEGHPYIFASFNGTKDDVTVLVHEMGHAFQSYLSRDVALEDYLTPTSESAEIHSMSLEFLSWPALEGYFGERAEAFRVEHLANRWLFLPYGCAIDHFQHLVYERPEASPDERRQMWLELQRRYLPWRDYGDVAYASRGNVWQQQLHVYNYPFYYIDYTLANCCALQFWAQAQRNRKDAVERYVALCARGGSASFRELAAGAGLESPFGDKALSLVIEAARKYLKAAELI
ncbi:MAG: M3 family oligoendopeptidase [Vulcanimicrobiaceae bacterium]